MAFKMNPKSPALKSTGMYSSPVKQVPGPGPISSPAKQTVRELPSKVVEGAGALLEKGKEKGKELLGKLGDIDVGNIFKKKTK